MKLVQSSSVQIRSRLSLLMAASGLFLCSLHLHAQGQQAWQPKAQSLFGADIERDESGDPILHFVGANSFTDHTPTNGRVSFILFRGQPAFKVWCSLQHMLGSGNRVSLGGVVITKDTVLYEVESGDQDYSSKDNVEALKGEGRLKISAPYPGYIDLSLKSGKKKVKVSVQDFGNRFGYYRETKQRELSGFLSQLISNFDTTVNAFESAAGLSDLETQLSPGARFHGLTKEEIAANIAERKAQLKAQDAEEKARRASEGGGGLTTFTTILTGVAQGLSDQSNTPILTAGNRQAAAMRDIGNASAARQQQAAQARVAAQIAATQQALVAIPQIQNRDGAMSNKSTALSLSANGSPVSGAVDQKQVTASEPSSDSSHYVASLPSGCIGQFWDPKYYNWLSFQNNCGQAVHLSWIAANPSDSFGMSAADLGPGAVDNSGWSQAEVQRKNGFLFFVCPAGYVAVDATTDEDVSRANQLFRCKQQ